MPETIRAFIALDLPPTIKTECERISQELAGTVPKTAVRWVQPEKMHLTLRFLGDTAVDKLPVISQSLDDLTQQNTSFSLQLNALGCFPNRKRPRVIWAGFAGNVAALQSLKKDVDAKLAPLGWVKENKPFRAHLTLGRVKNDRELAQMKWDVAINPLAFAVTAVALIESKLTSQGPIYTIRHQASLSET